MTPPAAYISYAWGDDDSPEGREREAIVDDLCRRFAEVGIEIGRDKNEVKPGDSIESFGTRIAEAPLILAVISKESLRSKYCMIYELYEAYVRRGSNNGEFADDVVALVLDDAKDELDEVKMAPLIDHWKDWCANFKRNLNNADPNKKRSLGAQKILAKSEDMLGSLPDMLIAISNIAMPRGSAEIRKDDFRAIIRYVQRKLPGASQDIPDPPEPDLTVLRPRLQQLALQHAALSPEQLHACWHGAIQDAWPQQSAANLFPQLASRVPLQWSDLQAGLADLEHWRHLKNERVERLFENFAARLEGCTSSSLADSQGPTPPSLAVLIRPIGERTAGGHPAYCCNAVLCIPVAEGGCQYERIAPAADHLFCFFPHKDRPNWRHPGPVLGRLWQAAQARLIELGKINREPFLDLFLPHTLLDQDWSGLELIDEAGEASLMRNTLYRLRSIDRWTEPRLLLLKEHFDRKHQFIKAGRGHWKLFAEGIESSTLYNDLSLCRSSDQEGQAEIVAILHYGMMGADPRNRSEFYKCALQSSAPVVMWLHHSVEDGPAKTRQKQLADLARTLNLKKPSKGRSGSKPVEADLLELPKRKQGLPLSLVVLFDDCLEIDPERPASPRLFSVADQALSLGYSSG